jgi:hypothetical protein
MLVAIRAAYLAAIAVEVYNFAICFFLLFLFLLRLRWCQAEALSDKREEPAGGFLGAKEKLRPY